MGFANEKHQVFREEEKTLEMAIQFIEELELGESEIGKQYKSLVDAYNKLLILTKRIFSISDIQGKALIQKKLEMQNLLDNANQGFLILDHRLDVKKEHSVQCVEIFGKKIADLHIEELFAHTSLQHNPFIVKKLKKAAETEEFEKSVEILRTLPSLVQIRKKYYNIQYKMLQVEDHNPNIAEIMLILTKIQDTEKKDEQITFLSYHDKLTSLYNRAYMESIIPIIQTEEYMPLSIIFIDMNGLKLTNDVFGHKIGDQYLCRMAQVLRSECKNDDIVARWGGDEFVVLVPKSTEENARILCQKLRDACERAGHKPIKLSASFGCRTCDDCGADFLQAITEAEKDMYSDKTKNKKRNNGELLESVQSFLLSEFQHMPEHIQRVTDLAIKLGERAGITTDSEEMNNLKLLAVFHDVGKAVLPDEIRIKKTKITEQERSVIMSYPEVGYRLAQALENYVLAESLYTIRECWDGSGYPRGLQEDQIPLIARIVSLVEAYDVMTHGAHYKQPMARDYALQEIQKVSGKQFDPDLAEVFIMMQSS